MLADVEIEATDATSIEGQDYAESLANLPGCSASYSVEDNKIRLYASARLDQETYERVKAAGYRWAPKQECFVCPRWTPQAEDLALELAGEIDDEDYSPLERAADRAERFTGYRDKRADEAEEAADRYDAGPQAFGHQSRARAERQARRHDRHRTYASTQWGKAEYWQERTRGVIAHAQHRADPRVRRGRIKELEADQRKQEATLAEYAHRYRMWKKLADLEGADSAIVNPDGNPYGCDPSNPPAVRYAYALANDIHCMSDYAHPRTGRESSLYSLMTDPVDRITAREAAALWLENATDPDSETSYSARWAQHYAARLEYERAMLANEGGTAADADMEPGGWFKGMQITKVNKSAVTGRVVSVGILAPTTNSYDRKGNPYSTDNPRPVVMHTVNVERAAEGAYRPPTDEERAAFLEATAKRKAEEKAKKPAAPSLLNPTDEDAERLQALWNAAAQAKHKASRRYDEYKPTSVRRMTQAEYSARSKGEYALYETRTLHADGRPSRRSSNLWTSEGAAYDKSLPAVACKVRVGPGNAYSAYSPDAVVIITDKPQKPLPIDFATLEGEGGEEDAA